MAIDRNMDRRRLLKSMAASGALARWPALAESALLDDPKIVYKVFSPAQAASMESLVDQLIPADDFPGAKDLGVVHFIDQKLASPFGGFFVPRYESGLKQLEELSRERFQQDFASLHGEQQSSLLHAIADKAHGDSLHEFFQTVLGDTFEGYYGSPADGGNRNGASWKMIGFKG